MKVLFAPTAFYLDILQKSFQQQYEAHGFTLTDVISTLTTLSCE